MTIPTLAVLGAFTLLVDWRVRRDREVDLEAFLASRAAGLASLVERDHGVWEVDEPEEALLASLTGVSMRTAGGEPIFARGAVQGKVWSGEFVVDDEDTMGPPPRIVLTLGTSLAPLDAEMWRLESAMAGIGLALGAISVLVGLGLARRIVGAEELHQLQARFDQQARFTADASHELRTPLALIRAEVDVALRREREAERYREALEGVQSGAERMQGILESLLLLARADAGGALEPVDVDLHAVASEACGSLVVTGGPAPMRGDPRLLGILVRNLVSNAVRHTPSGKVHVDTAVVGEAVRLVVRDEGEGIPEAALPHVLERFYRVDTARSRAAGGSGLGLSIVETVARLHGGSVDIVSRPGEGTTVMVLLPSGRIQGAG